MRVRIETIGILGVALAMVAPLHAQTTVAPRVLRVIQDPGAHAVWVLEANPLQPAGPGRLIEIRHPGGRLVNDEASSISYSSSYSALPLIRAGDHILIEQHTEHIDSWLSGVALEPAYLDATFRLRLGGGQVLRAVASGAHQARLVAQQSIVIYTGSAQP